MEETSSQLKRLVNDDFATFKKEIEMLVHKLVNAIADSKTELEAK